MSSIPQSCIHLIPNIIEIINQNLKLWCEDHQVVMIFAMQPVLSAIQSELSQRDYSSKALCHLCCTLNFFICNSNDEMKKKHWENRDAIVIDFTSGLIMDENYYFSFFSDGMEEGRPIGKIDQMSLNKVWM